MNSMAQMNLDDVVARNPDIVSTEMESETVMMSIERGAYFGLNAVGGLIWGMLEEPRTVASLCTALYAQFEVDEAECQAAVLRFIADMQHRGLVNIVQVTPTP